MPLHAVSDDESRRKAGGSPDQRSRLMRPTGEPLRVLIVEDEAMVQHLLEDMIVSHGGDVVAVTPWGTTAVMLAGQHRPDVALMDVALYGDMDGIDAARAIMARFHIPIVFISGKTDPDLGARIAALNGPELLDKPAAANRLIPAIRRACGLTD
jgi:two-component system, response regulator PdtaR